MNEDGYKEAMWIFSCQSNKINWEINQDNIYYSILSFLPTLDLLLGVKDHINLMSVVGLELSLYTPLSFWLIRKFFYFLKRKKNGIRDFHSVIY